VGSNPTSAIEPNPKKQAFGTNVSTL
jgi:hypothetical protein